MSAISIHSVRRIRATVSSEGSSGKVLKPVAPSKRSLRLTRRGRLVFIGVPFVLLAVLALVLVGVLTSPLKASVDSASGIEASKVTVQSGESIWSIAAEAGLNRDLRDVVSEIVQLNSLSTSVLSPGQQIFVPGK